MSWRSSATATGSRASRSSSSEFAPKWRLATQAMVWMSRSPPGPGLHVGLEVVGGVVGLQVALASARAPWPRRTPSPARCAPAQAPRASRRAALALPASRRASSSVVITPTSAALSSAHCSTVRTLWPTSRPMSQRKVTSAFDARRARRRRGAAAAPAQDVDVGSRDAARRGRSRRPPTSASSSYPARQLRAATTSRSTTSIELRRARAPAPRRIPRRRSALQFRVRFLQSPCGSVGRMARLRPGVASNGQRAQSRAGRPSEPRRAMPSCVQAAASCGARAPRVSTSYAGLGDQHRVLPLRRQRMILGDDRPAIAATGARGACRHSPSARS